MKRGIWGEALTNLYVGLCRFQRGEKLAAARAILDFLDDHFALNPAMKQAIEELW